MVTLDNFWRDSSDTPFTNYAPDRRHYQTPDKHSAKTLFFSLSFSGKHSIEISNRLRKLYRKYHPDISLRVIFKTTRRIHVSLSFPNKDYIPYFHRSSLVYKYTCGSCNAAYIGNTSRHLQTRVDEHHGISSHTGQPIYTSLHSSREHCHQTGHDFKSDYFTVLTSARTNTDLLTKESLQIHYH